MEKQMPVGRVARIIPIPLRRSTSRRKAHARATILQMAEPEPPKAIELAELVYAVQQMATVHGTAAIFQGMQESALQREADLKERIMGLWARLINGAEVVPSKGLEGIRLTPRAVEDYVKRLTSGSSERREL